MEIIYNGKIILENKLLTDHAIIIEDDIISQIIPVEKLVDYPEENKINAKGGFVAPGFIDIHSDYIEGIVSPRPTSMMDVNIGLREAEKILISHGITTMFHSLSFYGEDIFEHKPMRSPSNVQKLVDAIDQTHHEWHLIRHRLHARFEIDNIEEVDRLIDNIKADKVHLLSFMDHTPGQGQYRDLEVFRETLKGYRNISDSDVQTVIKNRQNRASLTIEKMKEIADIAINKGIAVASHDDDELSKIDLVKSFGTTISEFPITLEVAKKAKEVGLQTVAGAPNVLLGGSHSGNLSAAEAIEQGYINILCSDYYPASLLHAVFNLHETNSMPIHEVFRLVTINPARAVRIDHELGSIQPGKKADLIIIERMDDGYPMLTMTMVNGTVITTTNYRLT